MTCIAGVTARGKVYIGGDSAGVAGYSMCVRADEKVFRNGSFLFGFTSSFRMGQLLRYRFTPPAQAGDDYAYLCGDFIDAVRRCLKDGGYATVLDNQEVGGTFLLGYRGALYTVEDDYQVGRTLDDFAAVGAGRDVALGTLYASRLPPSRRIRLALQAAEKFSAVVRRPFHVLCV